MAKSIGKIVGRVLIQVGESEPIECGTIELSEIITPALVADRTGHMSARVRVDGMSPGLVGEKIREQAGATINAS